MAKRESTAYTTGITVKLAEEELLKLDRLAERTVRSRSDALRWLIRAIPPMEEQTDGQGPDRAA